MDRKFVGGIVGMLFLTFLVIGCGEQMNVMTPEASDDAEGAVFAAPADWPAIISGNKYVPLPGHPGYYYIIWIKNMGGGEDGGIEIYLKDSGTAYGAEVGGATRLAIWALNGYYAVGGSKTDFPYTTQYVQSVANEITIHCLYSFMDSANPVNIEMDDHHPPDYKVSVLDAINDWTNGTF